MSSRTTAHVIFNNVRDAAEGELRRSTLGLAFSGLSAGLNIGFSFLAVGFVLSIAGGSPSAPLWGAVAYPIGFILVIIARAQLFTENTLTPVILILSHPTRENVLDTARLWAVVLAANLAGAFLFSLAIAAFQAAPHIPSQWLIRAAEEAYSAPWGQLFLQAIFGGWLIALLVWMLHGGTEVFADIALIWLIAFIIQAAGFSHSVAGAVEVLYLAHQQIITYGAWAWNFQIPVTLGNIVGGVVFVALVNYGQAVGAGLDVERAARAERAREAREDRDRGRADDLAGTAEAAEERHERHETGPL